MSCSKSFYVALASLLTISASMSASASAESTPLPAIHTALPGELYPIVLAASGTAAAEAVNESSGLFKSHEGSVLLIASELTSLGQAIVDFLGIENAEKRTCHTEGDSEASGAVLIPGAEYHLVYTGLSPAHKLELGALMTFTKFITTCNAGAFEITATGPSIARLNVPEPGAGTEGDSTKLEGASHCGSLTTAIQEIPYYYGDNLEEIPTTLLLNPSGTGNKKSCLEAPGTTLLTEVPPGAATMFSVLF